MKQVLIRQGKVVLEEVPAPQCQAGHILVSVSYSCISAGTEASRIKTSGTPIWQRAFQHKQQVGDVLQLVNTIGLSRTYNLINEKLKGEKAAGYSASGQVIAVGSGIKGFKVGDRVACAGAQFAYHAEIITVPENLAVLIPDQVTEPQAATVTLGAIALQGIRRAMPTLGETFVVIGLGILGQLTSQILQANGCRVIGIDLDTQRLDLATQLGTENTLLSDAENNVPAVYRLTGGVGADGVIITAATSSDDVVANAFKMCRKKGRVVLVGDVGLNLQRKDFYEKELDFYISCSYGPGRYDQRYEEQGLDYPIGYVRWTENRNMAEYLRLIQQGKINVTALISNTFPVEQADQAYQNLSLLTLLQYAQSNLPRKISKVINPKSTVYAKNKIRLAVAGAGGFAKQMHLPNIAQLNNLYHLQAIMSRSGHNAKSMANKFSANYATTDYQQLLEDPEIDAILIATRHYLHAELVLRALYAGKNVLVEKPLALAPSELEKIIKFYQTSVEAPKPLLLTGFNRRFSMYAQEIKKVIADRTGPLIINYRMNAGYLPSDHWVQTAEGGGRNIGEACHIYDLFTFFTNSKITTVNTQAISSKNEYYSSGDNFITMMHFEDGSVANLIYTALGNKKYPKEQMEIFFDGVVISMNDYQALQVIGKKAKAIKTNIAEKGQLEELKAFAAALFNGTEWPIPFWQQIQATEISFAVEKELRVLGK
ncbi:MAG: bi-domain-containing oxidoreductase [Proteobacteria bacterium]|nr:bi-domain-containing oxidoreductase [Pseudomonadota bacterium]